MIKEWFETYNCKTLDEVLKAKREILQYIALAGLSRSDFFEKASFYGGNIKKGISLNLEHLQERAWQSGHLKKEVLLDENVFHGILSEKISNVDINSAMLDTQRFIINPSALNIWSTQYFHDLTKLIKFA